jgi:hypothetical protein
LPATPTNKLFRGVKSGGSWTWTDLTTTITYTFGGGTGYMLHWFGITDVEIDPQDNNIVYVTMGGFGQEAGGVMTKRVYKTTNANSANVTWTDISAGLPALTVNTIKCVPWSTDNEVLVGNDAGVYYRSNSTSGLWLIANFDAQNVLTLPMSIVSDIEIDESEGKVVVATYGRGTHYSHFACDHGAQNGISVVPGITPTYFSTSRRFDGDITIPEGATLIINNGATIGMDGSTKIVVEPGGTLIIDNATITSVCRDFWQGIEVGGLNDKSQYALYTNPYNPAQQINYQGKCIVKNNSIISRAVYAIRSDGRTGGSGGIIQVENSSLINNQYGIYLGSYKNFVGSHPPTSTHIRPNASYAINSNFVWDNDWIQSTPRKTMYIYIMLME